MKTIGKEIFSSSLQKSFKVAESDFTRTRKQSFSTTLLFMMNFLTKSLSIEIENFVDHLRKDCGLIGFKSFTKSAFVQYRKKIQPEDVVNQLKILFKKNLVPIRPNRSNQRNNGKYRRREKPKVTKNQKDTI